MFFNFPFPLHFIPQYLICLFTRQIEKLDCLVSYIPRECFWLTSPGGVPDWMCILCAREETKVLIGIYTHLGFGPMSGLLSIYTHNTFCICPLDMVESVHWMNTSKSYAIFFHIKLHQWSEIISYLLYVHFLFFFFS